MLRKNLVKQLFKNDQLFKIQDLVNEKSLRVNEIQDINFYNDASYQ